MHYFDPNINIRSNVSNQVSMVNDYQFDGCIRPTYHLFFKKMGIQHNIENQDP